MAHDASARPEDRFCLEESPRALSRRQRDGAVAPSCRQAVSCRHASSTVLSAARSSGTLVAPTGFEPAIFALKGRCPGPLDDGATCN